jgi:hypothetical protein
MKALRGRLKRLEKRLAIRQVSDPPTESSLEGGGAWLCPRCGGAARPPETAEEVRSFRSWTVPELRQAHDDLVHRHAWLGWCAACSRLVPVGQHDPDWRRQFWTGEESEAFRWHYLWLHAFRDAEPPSWQQAPQVDA